MVAFIVHYVHHLDPFRPSSAGSDTLGVPDAPTSTPLPRPPRPVLLLGGYSYGAMITAQMPPLYAILQPFTSPATGSDAAEVRLRAQHLAEQQNVVLASARAAMMERGVRSPSKRRVRVGGDEAGSPRKSHDSHGRRSFSIDEDRIRRGVHDFVAKAKSGRHGQKLFHHASTDGHARAVTPPHGQSQPDEKPDQKLADVSDLAMPSPAYLMVSPLQGLVNHLATMSLVPKALSKNKEPRELEAEEKLVRNPTLAVFGDTDVFVAVHRLRAWTKRLQERKDSSFQGREITSAGHFWVEEGVVEQLKDHVATFADELLGNDVALDGQ